MPEESEVKEDHVEHSQDVNEEVNLNNSLT